MKRLLIAALCLVFSSGCTIPVERTARTANKTDAEMKVDLDQCQSGGGWWFMFGPWPVVLVGSILALGANAVGSYNATSKCLEARGYEVKSE